jgi:hypothetical protein
VQEVEASSISRQLAREGRNDISPRDGLPLTPGVVPGKHLFVGRDNTVCIAVRYGPDGPWFGSLWEGRFSTPV